MHLEVYFLFLVLYPSRETASTHHSVPVVSLNSSVLAPARSKFVYTLGRKKSFIRGPDGATWIFLTLDGKTMQD